MTTPHTATPEDLPLSALPRDTPAQVVRVEARHAGDAIAARLEDLGFVSGEPLRVVARGPLGGDPLVVQIGYTRFALRRAEAERVRVTAAGKSA